jgi:predicted dehydrogenase
VQRFSLASAAVVAEKAEGKAMATMGKRRVRYAVVGLGNIAQVAVLPAFAHAKENSELVALVSSDAEKLSALAKRHNVELTGRYEDLESIVIEGKVDAVYVAVPNALHRVMTERAARAGAHVLCEKPMAVTEEDCQAMIDVTRLHGAKLMIGYRLHFDPANLRAIERIRAGEIGDPRIFSSVFCHQVRENDIRTRAELGGGALLDLGIYCLNAARYIFQDEPTEVHAIQVSGTDGRSSDVDEATTAVLTFPGNRIAQFTASQGAADVSEFRVVGTKGDIRLDPAYDYVGRLEETVTVEGEKKTTRFAKHDQFAPELVYFSKCILEGREPEPSGRHGLADVRIMQAMVQSAQSGTRIALTPVKLDARPGPDLRISKPPVARVKPVHAPAPSK